MKQPMTKLYHATLQTYLPEIKKDGLVPGKNKNWDCESGFVYLSNDMDTAISFCEAVSDNTPEEVYDSGICCFELDINAIDMQYLYKDPNILDADNLSEDNVKCFAYAKPVPFHKLHLIWTETNV